MTFHPYDGDVVLNAHSALYDRGNDKIHVNEDQWKQVLAGCTSALVYLQTKNILHNDIKADNVLIEGVQGGSGARGILIDFNKACAVCSGKVYRLSPEDQKYYAHHHPQVAPEVRKGVRKQSFASDIFAFAKG